MFVYRIVLKLKFETCEQCRYYKYSMEYKKKRYCYLTIKNAIQKDAFNERNDNYKYLLKYNFESDLEAIQRLLEYDNGYSVRIGKE